jgi:two-component system, LuxR family, response regulator FixJ
LQEIETFRLFCRNKIITIQPTVFIIDDDPDILKALRWLIESVGLNVECFESSVGFLETYDPNQCGCIVTDVRMPIMGGIQMLEQLNLRKNRLPVIVLTGHADVPMAVHAMKIGAIDFISKPFNDQYLLEQIQKSIALKVNECLSGPSENYTKRFAYLSKREQQVIKLIAVGKLNKQIAQELCISNSTVEFHRSRIMKKMGAKNLAQLINIYLKSQDSSPCQTAP